ncbi:MAG TPA: tripartite tricarboxylate transporter substrate binding protein [Xanthobacteraceae bacterium]|nr:tripartite tricarboxylate transporter substrate binding protein [Xanthobacteraceae bacterium]
MRRLLLLILLALASAAPARAQETVRFVVPFAAGGPVDTMARLLGNAMQGPLGQTIIVDDRAGAGGVIATELVSRAPADGRTLLFGSQGSHVVAAALRTDLKYDPVKSFTPIAMIGHVPMIVVVTPESPVKDLKGLIALAKTRKLSYGSAGPGSTMNLALELINYGGHVSITHIPYRGFSVALPDLLANRLDTLAADPPVILPLIAAKKVRALAVLGTERLASLPDVPTAVELGYPDMVMENWYGLLAPAGLAPDVAKKVEAAALTAIESPRLQEAMKQGETVGTLDAAGFKARIAHDVAFWGPMIKKLGIPMAN